jgi:hypothetical protein
MTGLEEAHDPTERPHPGCAGCEQTIRARGDEMRPPRSGRVLLPAVREGAGEAKESQESESSSAPQRERSDPAKPDISTWP